MRVVLSRGSAFIDLLKTSLGSERRAVASLSSFPCHKNNNRDHQIRSISHRVVVCPSPFPHSQSRIKTSLPSTAPTVRWFDTEIEYHNLSDEFLHSLVDAVEAVLEDHPAETKTAEVTFAAGVLTIQIPPHGTWVINKQTPNRQLWWSSPLSGPKRFEYDETDEIWFSTKDGLSLVPLLAQELSHILGTSVELEM